MRKFTSAICTALALTFAAGAAVPASAAPFATLSAPAASGNLIEVQSRQEQRRFERRENRRENRFERRQDRREARFERRNGAAYYNGQRGYSQRRAGYRQYNGFWFPSAAFIAGAVIGGAVANQPVVRSGGSAHVQWCADRWRSYRSADDSYQPFNGPRQRCVSPYS